MGVAPTATIGLRFGEPLFQPLLQIKCIHVTQAQLTRCVLPGFGIEANEAKLLGLS